MTEINQKEYLKKYLGIGKADSKKKKHKKKPKTVFGPGLKIVDDDLDISEATTVEEAVCLLATNEDAPQIVGVIDERPPALRVDDYRKSDRWKAIGENDDYPEAVNVNKDNSPPRKKAENTTKRKGGNNTDSDNSPPRRNKSKSPEINNRKRRNLDISPSRKKSSPRIQYDSDNSPPRKQNRSSENKRNQRNSENSPLRRANRSPNNRKQYDSDNSPPRKDHIKSRSPEYSRKRRDSDNSPPRKRNKSPELERKQYDSDNSPPRRNSNRKESPEHNRSRNRYNQRNRGYGSKNKSPPSLERGWGNKDKSPPLERGWGNKNPNRLERGFKKEQETTSKIKKYESDSSPLRKTTTSRESPSRDRRKLIKDDDGNKKMTKTLDGKTAGLQNARELDKETALLKQREDEHFKTLSADVSGANASTIIRDRKTGKIRDLNKEAEEKREKQKRDEVHKEKYTRWGKGLKQVEDREEKLAQDVYEMSKPLARYADDVDLERHLKEQEREGDPMLAYIRSKKKKQSVASGKPTKPQYDGEFMPNRYGIAPGHRWDGVDRSNGYERRWFETQNAKKAQEDESYKWSTEDM